MSEKRLFEDFSPVSDKAWKQKIQVDLKGADYNETLLWESPEGIKVKPFYSSKDLEGGEQPSLKAPVSWKIGQHIMSAETANGNKQSIEALEHGVESLILKIGSSHHSPASILNGIDLSTTRVYLDVTSFSPDELKTWLKELPAESDNLFILHDLLGHLESTGNWFGKMEDDLQIMEEVFTNHEKVKLFTLDLSLYQNSGANRVQQLAYALAKGKEYFGRIPAIKDRQPLFTVSVDTNYFFEIAKLRALRLLWYRLAKRDGLVSSAHLLAFPTKRNKTLYDYNVNMLRSTTECMAGILGGADTVYNMPYDSLYHHSNEFAERIARNQLLILKNESYFDKVANAADGAYYIESLTAELVEKSWALFEQIEKSGGYLKQLKEHKIHPKIRENARKQQEDFDEGREVLVGSNKYPNEADQMKGLLDKDPFMKRESKKTLIEPILEKRLAEALEQNRLDHE